jgi:hypothetical protein
MTEDDKGPAFDPVYVDQFEDPIGYVAKRDDPHLKGWPGFNPALPGGPAAQLTDWLWEHKDD